MKANVEQVRRLIAGFRREAGPPTDRAVNVPIAVQNLHLAADLLEATVPRNKPEQDAWAPEPDIDLDPTHGPGAHEAWEDGWAKGFAAAQPAPNREAT